MKSTDTTKIEIERIKKEQALHVISNLSSLLYNEIDLIGGQLINRLGLSETEEKTIRKKIMTYVNQL
jgi:hypothetical protein